MRIARVNIQSIFRVGRLRPCAALVAAAGLVAGCKPAFADPLLRENWTAAERARVAGFVSRLTEAIESPADRYRIPDGAGRNFYIDDRGGLHFEPLYDGVAGNWRPVVPDVRNAPLYFHEARALYGRGLKDEALYLMKALRSMLLVAEEPDSEVDFVLREAIQGEARRATQWLNAKRERDPDFARLDRMTDPFAIYNGAAGRTVVLSNQFEWRLRLPGSWRFQRGQDPLTRAADPNRNMVYLKHAGWRLAIGSDMYAGAPGRFANLKSFVREWDLRRTLTPPRKRALSFRRETLAEDLALCPDAGRGREQCAVFRTGLRDRAR
ncbi:MAG: hypothetical protein RIF32_00065, partial [Leptospirales bacterium]